MTACRAKMVDGSPVTFDWKDWLRRAPSEFGGDCWVSEFVGEGFHVRSEVSRLVSHNSRIELDRDALERSGVDTATAEWLQDSEDKLYQRWMPLFPLTLRMAPSWEKMYDKPDTSSQEYQRVVDMLVAEREMNRVLRSKLEQRLVYVGAEGLLSEKAMAAGAAVLKDMVVTRGMMSNGRIWFSNPDFVVSAIWRAMEKARK